MADIDDLDSTARDLLAAYRGHSGPSPEAAQRLLVAIRRSAAAPAEARTRVIPNRRWTTVAVAGLLAAAVVAALRMTAGPAVEASRDAGHAAPDSVDAPPSAPVSRGVVATPGAVLEPVPSPPVPKDIPARTPRTSPVRPAAPPSLASELAFMRTVQAELGAGAPARALDLLREYPARFPGGHLGEEALALRAVAGCGVRLDAASQATAAGFVQARPGSLFAQRVRAACGLP